MAAVDVQRPTEVTMDVQASLYHVSLELFNPFHA